MDAAPLNSSLNCEKGKSEMQNRTANNAPSHAAGARQCDGSQPLLDVEVTLSRFAGDEALLAEIAAVFVKTVPQLMRSLSDAVTSSDLKGAFHHAHSLKGAVAAFEAPEVLCAVLDVEAHAKKGDATATARALPVARALVEGFLGELALLGPAASAA